jgi:hypothetical protein
MQDREARAKASALMYRAAPANVLSRAKPQNSQAALQMFVMETSQTAGNSSFSKPKDRSPPFGYLSA